MGTNKKVPMLKANRREVGQILYFIAILILITVVVIALPTVASLFGVTGTSNTESDASVSSEALDQDSVSTNTHSVELSPTTTFTPTVTVALTATETPTLTPIPTVTESPTPTVPAVPEPIRESFVFDEQIKTALDLIVGKALINELGEPICEDAVYYATYSQEGASPIIAGYFADNQDRPGYLYLYLCGEGVDDRSIAVFNKEVLDWASLDEDNRWGNYRAIIFKSKFEGISMPEKIQDFKCRWLPDSNTAPIWFFPMSHAVFDNIYMSGIGTMGDWMFDENCD